MRKNQLTQEEVQRRFDNIGWKVLEPYVNSKTPIKCSCPEGHVQTKKIEVIVNKKCKACSGLKFFHKDILEEFEKNGWKLLSTYINQSLRLKCICQSGHTQSRTLTSLRNTDYLCFFCSGKSKTTEMVSEEFIAEGFTLLNKYKNKKDKLEYICPEGHRGNISYVSWNKGCRCQECRGNKKLTYSFVKKEFETEGWSLLSESYVGSNDKLKCMCSKGHIQYKTYSHFREGNRCAVCSGKAAYTIDRISEMLSSEGFTLIDTVYKGVKHRLNYLCSEGHVCQSSLDSWNQGCRCLECSGHKRHTIEKVSKDFTDEGYTLLSKNYYNNAAKLDYVCDKGHTNSITYGEFSSGNRCPVCNKELCGKEHWNYKAGPEMPLYSTYGKRLEKYQMVINVEKDGFSLVGVKCHLCKKVYVPTSKEIRHRIYAIENSGNGESNIYCSDECKEKCSTYGQVSRFKDQKQTRQVRWQSTLWADKIKQRDNYICQKCGNKGDIAHHKIPVKVCNMMELDPDNGITLCEECHKKSHQIPGCTYSELRNELP